MQNLTPEGLRMVAGAAERHGVSLDAAVALLGALAEGNGRQAQFNHPDLGGMGQWSQGGMIMVGDMFNHGLKARVDALCNELAGLLHSQPSLPVGGQSQSRSSAAPPPAARRTVCGTPFSPTRVVSRSWRTAGSACTTPASIGSPASRNSRAAIGR
jgi:hypothetical protein